MKQLLASLLFLLLSPWSAFAGETSPAPSIDRGVNMGNMMEAPKEGAWGESLRDEYFALIRQAGFTSIRIPIRWAAHASPAPGFTIDPAFFARVDHVVALARENHLQAILDYHNDDALTHDPAANTDRFVALWKQIAEHYRNEPSSILFELFNEPCGKLDADAWNALIVRTLAAVRESNPTRTVVIGPVQWNSINALPKLVLPDLDQNILVTVHFYDPMGFTHQGASWVEGSEKWLGNTWDGTEAQKQAVTTAFDKAAAWASANHRPIFLGEFGAYSKGDMASRARWTSFVARTAEAHHMPWYYWEFCSGFGVYDPQARQWRPPLLHALIPPASN